MQALGHVGASGTIAVHKIGAVVPAPLEWKLRNSLRPGFIKGWVAKHAITPLAKAFGLMTAIGELSLRQRTWCNDLERQHFAALLRAGRLDEAESYARLHTYWIDYGVVSYRVVTDAGVAYMVDDFDNGAGSADISLFNFHGIGTGTNAEAVGDTALQTESTTALNPDSTRATGTRSQPAANQYRSIGTLTADASIAATEHGLFTTSGTGTGTLLDRSVYTVINLANLDSLQATYTLTLTSGS